MRWLPSLTFVLLLSSHTCAQTRLQRAGGIRPPALPALPSPPASDPAPSKQNSSSNPGWSGEGLESLLYLAGAIVASLFIVPHWAVDDDIHCDGSFLHFPYEN